VVSEKGARTIRIPITTGHLMSLTDKQFGQQRPGRTDSKNKDPHGVATLPQLSGHFAAPSALARILLQGADSEGSPLRTFNEHILIVRVSAQRSNEPVPFILNLDQCRKTQQHVGIPLSRNATNSSSGPLC
jgi:hypothetical protein